MTIINLAGEIVLEPVELCVIPHVDPDPDTLESECRPIRCGTFDPNYKSPVLEKLRLRREAKEAQERGDDYGIIELLANTNDD